MEVGVDVDYGGFDLDGVGPVPLDGPPPEPPAEDQRPPRRPLPADWARDGLRWHWAVFAMVVGVTAERVIMLTWMPGGKELGLAITSAVFILTVMSGMWWGAWHLEQKRQADRR